MPNNDTMATSHIKDKSELQRVRRELAELEAERDRSVGELLQVVRRYRGIAWAAIGTLQTKAVVGISVATVYDVEWWLNAGTALAGLGLAGVLVAPNARKLWSGLRSMSSLTMKFKPEGSDGRR